MIHKKWFIRKERLCFLGGTVVKNLPANAGNSRNVDLIPGSGRSAGEGNGNLLQYSCLENPIDRRAWRATVHGVTKSWTWLSTHTHEAYKGVGKRVWLWELHGLWFYNQRKSGEGEKTTPPSFLSRRHASRGHASIISSSSMSGRGSFLSLPGQTESVVAQWKWAKRQWTVLKSSVMWFQCNVTFYLHFCF